MDSWQEAFICGTTTGVQPLVEIDGRPIGDGSAGSWTRQLAELFEAFERQMVAAASALDRDHAKCPLINGSCLGLPHRFSKRWTKPRKCGAPEWQPTDQGGQLRLPVVQGLRHGIVQGTLSAAPEETGTSLRFDVEETSYAINRSALAILLLGGMGGLTVVFWPLSPMILQLAPIGAVLALVAWLMVVSKLRNSDPEDFFDLVADLSEHSLNRASGILLSCDNVRRSGESHWFFLNLGAFLASTGNRAARKLRVVISPSYRGATQLPTITWLWLLK